MQARLFLSFGGTVRRGAGIAALVAVSSALAAPPLNVGSKRFTESYILGEIIKQTANAAGETTAVHQQGLGNTAIVLNALTSGNIDVYPEYTGTIAKEILKLDAVPPLPELNAKLGSIGLAVGVSLGFNNTYALAIRSEDARSKNITKLSDLKAHPELRLGLSQEFIGRADGWPGLKQAYDLPFATPRGLDHGLAYDAIEQKQVDAIDIYSTDAKIDKAGLIVLADDRNYFPRYDAVLLYRADLPQRLPKTWSALKTLEGRIDDATMRRMNAAAELEGKDFASIAAAFLAGQKSAAPATATGSTAKTFLEKLFGPDFGRLTGEHVALVFISLLASVAVGIPLGILAAKRPATEGLVLGATGVLQTIPSLALLAVLIPLTGRIGAVPAFIALALYALLPIVRNTHTALAQISKGMREAAQSLGLTAGTILQKIELPLSAPTIVAGIKTSAVINVGTATIAAFIGAGGYGERIVTGLALNDHEMLLAGAIPAAVLALLIEAVFRFGERWIIPEGLRQSR
ncbi:MAG TPA: glycine betaine ABC transporter substrate-binding protein [Casimicrobiaceae bacterium]|jgi:osmoprotectant transport system permease protein|nr:glycine betaine ABC transporter substrate-binding protein [Casimicrobiaceae bacterium]